MSDFLKDLLFGVGGYYFGKKHVTKEDIDKIFDTYLRNIELKDLIADFAQANRIQYTCPTFAKDLVNIAEEYDPDVLRDDKGYF